MESFDYEVSSEVFDVGVPEEAVSEEAVSEEAASEEVVSEEAVSEEVASEEVVSEEAVSEEVASEESALEETQAPAELYSAEVVHSIDTLVADLENTNLILMCFFVVFCILSLRKIVFGIRKNIFGR